MLSVQSQPDIINEKVPRSTAEAFAKLYEQYLPKVFRYINYRVTDTHMAEDLTSVVFEKALTKYTSYNPGKAAFSTWIFSIARNTVIDHYRVTRKEQTVQLDNVTGVSSEKPSPEEAMVRAEELKTLQSCIAQLPHQEQEIISLKFGAAMNNRQIASMLGLGESNVLSVSSETALRGGKMSNEHDVEKQFSENVDRLLAGNKVNIDPAAEDDLRTATDFAQKMVEHRAGPSDDFKADLKERLLAKLKDQEAEKQVKEDRSWFRRLIPRRQAWQFAISLTFIVAMGAILWAVLKPGAAPPSAPGTFLQVQASTNKASYRAGEQVKIEVSLKNVTSETIRLEQFPPILSLMQTESRQPVYTFVGEREARTLTPGESTKVEIAWDQRDDKGKYVTSGGYYLELEDLDYQGKSMKLNLTRPVEFNIH